VAGTALAYDFQVKARLIHRFFYLTFRKTFLFSRFLSLVGQLSFARRAMQISVAAGLSFGALVSPASAAVELLVTDS
jgi:hypothetical protein